MFFCDDAPTNSLANVFFLLFCFFFFFCSVRYDTLNRIKETHNARSYRGKRLWTSASHKAEYVGPLLQKYIQHTIRIRRCIRAYVHTYCRHKLGRDRTRCISRITGLTYEEKRRGFALRLFAF